MTARTLFRNGVVHGDHPSAADTALAVEGDRIAWVGDEDGAASYDGADEVVDLHGAFLAPAFVDSHVHTVQAGFRLTELDLHGSPSLADTLGRLARHAAGQPPGSVLIGQGWDESLWPEARPPTGAELERAAPGMRTLLSRVDGHSSIVSPALVDAVPGVEGNDGWTGAGRVERDAHHAVRAVMGELVGSDQRLDAARVACARMTAHGLAGFHENAAPHIGPEYEIDLVRLAAQEAGLRATVYWGELGAIDTACRLGASGLAGDLNADGALGSRTAALHEPYADRPDTRGHGYLSAEQVAEHVILCTEAGLQAGFHCIGDAALDAIADGFEHAAAKLGGDRVCAARHRLEHVEMPSARVIDVIARLGVTASVQPMFDALWGGPEGMYAERLGDRWRGTNPFLALETAPVRLAFGSDSPVTPLGPWAAVRAAVHHHAAEHRLGLSRAFRAHTSGGWKAGRDDDSGHLVPGSRADLAIWHLPAGLGPNGLPVLEPDVELPRLVRAVGAGRTLHDSDLNT